MSKSRRQVGPEDEIKSLRTVTSKTFRTGPASYRLRKTMGPPLHYLKNGRLEDVDITPRFDRGDLLIDKAPFALRLKRGLPAYRYRGLSGEVSVELVALGESKPAKRNASDTGQGGLLWSAIAKDTDYAIIPRQDGCATILTLYSDDAPKTWTWEIIGDRHMLRDIVGYDAKRRRCEIEVRQEGDRLVATWTGRVIDRGIARARAANKHKSPWSDDPAYPVSIDPTVNETLSAGSDDIAGVHVQTFFGSVPIQSHNLSSSYLGVFSTAGVYFNFKVSSGFRFQGVAVPPGATIDAAVLAFQSGPVNGIPLARVFGLDADNANSWNAVYTASNKYPGTYTGTVAPMVIGMPKTAAYALLSGPASYTAETIGISAVVQEIVNRAGWSSSNDMAFAISPAGGAAGPGGPPYFVIWGREINASYAATLEIDYSFTSIEPTLFVDGDAFYEPALADFVLDPVLFEDGDTFYTPAVVKVTDPRIGLAGVHAGTIELDGQHAR